MSSTIDSSGHKSYQRSGKGCCSQGNWGPMNIGAMVVGFILFWPVGLVILYWNITGRDLQDLPKAAQNKWNDLTNGDLFNNLNTKQQSSGSDNSVFEEFQQTQFDRIREIKEEIKTRARNFRDFRNNTRRKEEEAEFNEFMSNKQKHEQ